RGALALDGPAASAKVKVAGTIVTNTTVRGDDRWWAFAFDPETLKWRKLTPAQDVRLSPDGATVAFGLGSGVWTCPLKGDANPRRIGEVGDRETMKFAEMSLSWWPNGDSIVATGYRGASPELKGETRRFYVRGDESLQLPIPATDYINDVAAGAR